jgi:hypothetical protein
VVRSAQELKEVEKVQTTIDGIGGVVVSYQRGILAGIGLSVGPGRGAHFSDGFF